jgi:hypothetical protein
MVNNLDKIKSLLVFEKGVTYYFIQVIQRKKENPDLPKSEMQRGFWYITSMEELEIHWPRIKKTCEDYNARAYISLIPRSLEKLGKKCLMEYSKRVINNEYSRVFAIPQKNALSKETIYSKGEKPWWCVDIDNPEQMPKISEYFLLFTNIKAILETPNGYHLIVECFNPKVIKPYATRKDDYKFASGEEFTLRKECNTILYSKI